MDLSNHRDKPSESDISDSTQMEMSGSVLDPQAFPLFPPGSFKLSFLLSAPRSYGNLLHYVSISLHLREIR